MSGGTFSDVVAHFKNMGIDKQKCVFGPYRSSEWSDNPAHSRSQDFAPHRLFFSIRWYCNFSESKDPNHTAQMCSWSDFLLSAYIRRHIVWLLPLKRGLDTFGRFSAIFYKGDNFCDLRFAFHNNYSCRKKGSSLKGKNSIPLGINSFLLKYTIQKRNKKNLEELPILKVYKFLLKELSAVVVQD